MKRNDVENKLQNQLKLRITLSAYCAPRSFNDNDFGTILLCRTAVVNTGFHARALVAVITKRASTEYDRNNIK